jgi:hypothetical protein
MLTNVESDTIHLTHIGQPLAEIVHIWHFGDFFSILEADCFSMLEAFLPMFSKSLLLAPAAFGQNLSSSFLIVSSFIDLFSFTSSVLFDKLSVSGIYCFIVSI